MLEFKIGDRVKAIPGSRTDRRFFLNETAGTIYQIDVDDIFQSYRIKWDSEISPFWTFTADIIKEMPLHNREALSYIQNY